MQILKIASHFEISQLVRWGKYMTPGKIENIQPKRMPRPHPRHAAGTISSCCIAVSVYSLVGLTRSRWA